MSYYIIDVEQKSITYTNKNIKIREKKQNFYGKKNYFIRVVKNIVELCVHKKRQDRNMSDYRG